MFLLSVLPSGSSPWRRRGTEPGFAKAGSLPSKSAGLRSFRNSLPELAGELARARRYERPFAIVVLSPETHSAKEDRANSSAHGGNATAGGVASGPLASAGPLISLLLDLLLRDALRGSDIVAHAAADGRYVLLLTEADAIRARQTIRRLEELAFKSISVHLRAGVAVFPQDGLTLEELVHCAQAAWLEQPISGAAAEARAGEQI